MKLFTTFLLILFIGITTNIKAQDVPVVSFGKLTTTASNATVPVAVDDFTDIKSFDLRIKYDQGVAVPTIVEKGDNLNGGLTYDLNTPGVIKLIWNAPMGSVTTLADGETLINIIFNRVGYGVMNLVFDESQDLYDCQFYDAEDALYDLPGENFYISGTLEFEEHVSPVTIAPDITAVPGSDITIPIKVNEFKRVGSVSLTLKYDPLVLSFIEGLNSDDFPDLFIGSPEPGTIRIAGITSEPDGISFIEETILANLNFHYLGGSTYLDWFDNGVSCEYSSPEGAYVLPDTLQSDYYINGSVGPEGLKLDVTVLLEGCFNSTDMNTTLNSSGLIPLSQPYNTAPWNYAGTESVAAIPAGVVDWVLLELREATEAANATGATILAQKAVFLKSDGSVVDLDGTSVAQFDASLGAGNNLYVVVRHRNHLAIMSNTGATLNGDTYEYDFTTAVTQAYGGSIGFKTLSGGVCGMVAGDINGDGNIFASDYGIWASDFGQTLVYRNSDLNIDGNVFASDYGIWTTNFGQTGDDILKSGNKRPKYFSSIPK